MPKRCCSVVASSAMRRSARATGATSSMYGRVRGRARSTRRRCSRSTLGANGRKLSRNLIFRFITDCIFGTRGSPRMLRAPSARGPNSMRPWNQPTTFSSASSCGDVAIEHLVVVDSARRRRRPSRGTLSISSSENAGRASEPRMRVGCAMRRRGVAEELVPDRRARRRARRPRRRRPAGSRGRSNGPSRRIRPLPTQFSATPPARQRFSLPVSRARARHAQHDLLGDLLDRRGEVHLALRQRRLGLARRAAEQPVERAVRHRQARAVVEVRHVQPERAVGLQIDQIVEDQLARTSARRRARGPSPCTRRSSP